MFFYMFNDDATGREVCAALVSAAERGVNVQLIIDSFGSSKVRDRFFDELIAAGGAYHSFSTRKGFGYLIRNHQKILVVDGAHALVGGFNITDAYFGRAGDASWEDLGMIVSGPQAQKLYDYFEDMARASNNGKVRFRSIRTIIHRWRPGVGQVQWLLGGPTNRISPGPSPSNGLWILANDLTLSRPIFRRRKPYYVASPGLQSATRAHG